MNNYKHGKYRIHVAGDQELKNKPIIITDEKGNDVFEGLAEKAYVDNNISTASATFRGTSEQGLTEQQFLAWANALTHDKNDYVFWYTLDASGNDVFKRYKWDGTQWVYEFSITDASNAPRIFYVDDITTLSNTILNNLRNGDVVVENATYKKTFVVSFYFEEEEQIVTKEIYLSYTDGNAFEVVTYYYNGQSWECQERSYDYLSEKANKIRVATSQPQGGMLPNTLYNLGALTTDTTFTMAAATDTDILNHWYWTFETGESAPTITWPAAILEWADGSAPTISASKHYEISVLCGVACVLETDIPTSN